MLIATNQFTVIGKMRNCGMRKVKCGIEKCGNGCGMVGKMRNAEKVGGKPTDNSISRPCVNMTTTTALRSQLSPYVGYCRSDGDYRISTRFNSGRQRSRRFRYATDTRKRQTCKGLRSTVNAIRTSDSEIVQSMPSEDSVKSHYRHNTDV